MDTTQLPKTQTHLKLQSYPTNSTRPSRKFGAGLILGAATALGFIGVWEAGKSRDGSSIVYADKLARGLPTVCSGITKHVTTTPIIVGERWPAEKCKGEEQKAIITLQLKLEQCFNLMPQQHVFDMATSHAWNNGVGATCGSGAMILWNKGDWWNGCRRLAYADSGKRVWSYVKDGKGGFTFVQGLANRRSAEYQYCMLGRNT